MSGRTWSRGGIGVVTAAVIVGMCGDVEAQQPPVLSPPAQQQAWTPPMTAWGEPDLRGTWPLNHLISTPFQRPERFGDRRFLTDEEFAAAQKSADDRNQRFQSGAIPQADAGQAIRQGRCWWIRRTDAFPN